MLIHLWCGRPGFNPWDGKIPWRRERLPTPVFWPGEVHGIAELARLGDFHFHEYYKAIKTRKSCHLWQSWINLEGIMLSEITQREIQILYDLTYMWNHGI